MRHCYTALEFGFTASTVALLFVWGPVGSTLVIALLGIAFVALCEAQKCLLNDRALAVRHAEAQRIIADGTPQLEWLRAFNARQLQKVARDRRTTDAIRRRALASASEAVRGIQR